MDIDPSSALSRKEKIFFNTAKEISNLSDHHYHLGCVIVDHHRIISSGHNSNTKCHPIQKELDTRFFGEESRGPVHAELAALLPLIKQHNIDLSGATLYTYREDKHDHIAMSRPCPRCMSLIKKYGIKKIKYTTTDGFVTEKLI
jgi:deoxycytidylate deaminase